MSRPLCSITGLATFAALALAACSDSPAGPGAGGPQLSRDITVAELNQALDTAAARVEIKLVPGTLVAREVELKTPDEMQHRESVRAPVTEITASGGSGTLALALGGLEVRFDGATRLRNERGDVSFDGFVAEIEAALAAGAQPFVRAKRPAANPPQAPDDAAFLADEIRIRASADEPKLELNVDRDNFAVNNAPPPDAFLDVLGLTLEIRAGQTELESDLDDHDEAEFESLVQAVDVPGGSVTLTNGTVVLVIGETHIEQDDDDELGSLQDVAGALAAGQPVKAEGQGGVQGTSPLTIVAREIEFEVEDDDEPGQGAEFEAAVTVVDVPAGLVTLAGGTTVRLIEGSVIEPDGDLFTLQAVADAVAAGRPVRAEGRGVVESAGPPVVLVAATIKFEVDD